VQRSLQWQCMALELAVRTAPSTLWVPAPYYQHNDGRL